MSSDDQAACDVAAQHLSYVRKQTNDKGMIADAQANLDRCRGRLDNTASSAFVNPVGKINTALGGNR